MFLGNQKLHALLANVIQLVGMLSHKPNGHRFDSWSGYMPQLWIWTLVGARMRGKRSMFRSLSPRLPSPSLKPISMFQVEDEEKVKLHAALPVCRLSTPNPCTVQQSAVSLFAYICIEYHGKDKQKE